MILKKNKNIIKIVLGMLAFACAPLLSMEKRLSMEQVGIYENTYKINGQKRVEPSKKEDESYLVFSNLSFQPLQIRIKAGSLFDDNMKKLKDGKVLFLGAMKDRHEFDLVREKFAGTLTIRFGKDMPGKNNYEEKDYGEGYVIYQSDLRGLRGISIIHDEFGRQDYIRILYAYNFVGYECPICFHSFIPKDNEILVTKCGHMFHYNCAKSFLAATNSCPSCRSPFKEEFPGKLYKAIAEELNGPFRIVPR